MELTSSAVVEDAAYVDYQALAFGRVLIAASAPRLPASLEPLPERPLAKLTAALKDVADIATGSKHSSEERHGCNAEDRAASELDNTKEAMGEPETVPGTRGKEHEPGRITRLQGRHGLVPHVQPKIARILHAHYSKCLRRYLHEQEGR